MNPISSEGNINNSQISTNGGDVFTLTPSLPGRHYSEDGGVVSLSYHSGAFYITQDGQQYKVPLALVEQVTTLNGPIPEGLFVQVNIDSFKWVFDANNVPTIVQIKI